MTCKGICIRHKALRPRNNKGARYSVGQKRCQTCDIFVYSESIYCFCCGYRLRVKPRLGRAKQTIMMTMK
jgi:hypothetical protein